MIPHYASTKQKMPVTSKTPAISILLSRNQFSRTCSLLLLTMDCHEQRNFLECFVIGLIARMLCRKDELEYPSVERTNY
jgi:hypothetical protein